jgi:hypothetical protein
VVEAPVQQQVADTTLQHLPLVLEQLQDEQPCQLLGNFFDEFQLGETLGQASVVWYAFMHDQHLPLAALPARRTSGSLHSSSTCCTGGVPPQLLFL